jgi:hypothetical protein
MRRSPNPADHVGLVIDPSWTQNPLTSQSNRQKKFVTIVNITTTKVIGIEVPTTILLRADLVIE